MSIPAILLLGAVLLASPAAAARDSTALDGGRAAPPDSTVADSLDALPWRLRPVAVLATAGDGRGQVIEPSGVCVDPFGRLVIADAALHRLQRLEPDGRWLGESGSLGSDPGQLRRPGSVTMLGTLGVAVLDRENHRVESYDLFGRRLGTVVDLRATALADEVGRIDPVALASDRGGALYVADADRDRILAFDVAGRFQRVIGGFGARPGSFRGLGGLAAVGRGGLVTAERVNGRVQRLDAAGRIAASWPLAVATASGALPVAVDDAGRIAVADESAGTLWIFTGEGRPLAVLTGLRRPRALAFAPGGTLLIAEAGRGEVRRFALEPRDAGTPKD